MEETVCRVRLVVRARPELSVTTDNLARKIQVETIKAVLVLAAHLLEVIEGAMVEMADNAERINFLLADRHFPVLLEMTVKAQVLDMQEQAVRNYLRQ